jgi:hypothetical protein
LLGLSSLNLPLSGGTLNGTLNGTVATFSFNKWFTVLSSAFTIKRNKFEIRNVNEISSISDRTNSLYKPLIIDGSNITLKYNGNDALTIVTSEATFAQMFS